jgi:hypothetical protein
VDRDRLAGRTCASSRAGPGQVRLRRATPPDSIRRSNELCLSRQTCLFYIIRDIKGPERKIAGMCVDCDRITTDALLVAALFCAA